MKVFLYSFVLGSDSLNVTNDNTAHTYAGITYTASAIDSKEFSFDLKEIMGEVAITIPWSQCDYIQTFTQYSLEGPVEVTVYRYDTTLSTATLVFKGFVNSFKVSKAVVELQCISFIEQSRDNYSRLVLTRHCNHRLYSDLCTMIPGNWAYQMQITSISFDRTQLAVGPPPGGVTGGFFTYGYVKNADAYRWITGDTWSADAFLIDLIHPAPVAWTLNTSLWCYAGCDKTMDMCETKFNNIVHFMGFPYAPYESIRFTGLRQQETTMGGKK